MEISEKYGFYLPSRDTDDIADINQISENFRIIDENIPSKEDLENLGSNVDNKQDKFADVTERDGAVILTSTVSDDRPPRFVFKNGVLELGAMHLQFGDGMGEVSLEGLNAPDDSLNINANDSRIRNVADPKFDKDAVNKKYFERNLPSVDQAYNPDSSNAQSGIAVAEAVAPKKQTISIDTPIFDVQPTVSGALNEAFSTAETQIYYVTLKNTDGTALENGKFKLSISYDGYASAIEQVFTANGKTYKENQIVEFKTISADRKSFEMRDAGVYSIKIYTKNKKSQRYVFTMNAPVAKKNQIAQGQYLYLTDSVGTGISQYYQCVSFGSYTGGSGFLFPVYKAGALITHLGCTIEAQREIRGFVGEYSGLTIHNPAGNLNSVNPFFGIIDPSKVSNFQKENIDWFELGTNNSMLFRNGTSVTLEEFA